MSPGIIGIQQEYSASGEGRQLSFRAYDTAKGRKVFTMTEGYDRTGGPEDFTDVTDVDGPVHQITGTRVRAGPRHRVQPALVPACLLN